MSKEKYRIGVDIGGTNISAGIVTGDGKIIEKVSCKTMTPRPADEICDSVKALCVSLIDKAGIKESDVSRVGIGCPGYIVNGIVRYSGNLGFTDVDLKTMMEKRLPCPVSVCNDANAAAYAEYLFGAGKGCGSLAAITIGTGIGGGFVLDGKVIEGFGGAGAEFGHMTIVPNGRKCSCCGKGCFEAYCSATAVIADTRAVMANHPESKLWDFAKSLDDVDGKTLFKALRLGDAAAEEVFGTFTDCFARGIVNIIALLQPEIVCIGGGMSNEGDTLIEPIRRKVNESGFIRSSPKKTRIVAAERKNDAGILGAAFMDQ